MFFFLSITNIQHLDTSTISIELKNMIYFLCVFIKGRLFYEHFHCLCIKVHYVKNLWHVFPLIIPLIASYILELWPNFNLSDLIPYCSLLWNLPLIQIYDILTISPWPRHRLFYEGRSWSALDNCTNTYASTLYRLPLQIKEHRMLQYSHIFPPLRGEELKLSLYIIW